MHRAAMLFLCLTAVAFPLSKSYDVVPYRNYIGLQEDGEVGVTQFYRNTLDSLTCISFWVGDTVDTSSFKVEVRDSVSGALLAQTYAGGVQAPGSWSWMPCSLVTTNGKRPVRGRTYKVSVTRPSGSAISYAYDPRESTYAYGCLVVGNEPHPTEDLALRVYGLMNPIDSTYWGMVPMLPWGEIWGRYPDYLSEARQGQHDAPGYRWKRSSSW